MCVRDTLGGRTTLGARWEHAATHADKFGRQFGERVSPDEIFISPIGAIRHCKKLVAWLKRSTRRWILTFGRKSIWNGRHTLINFYPPIREMLYDVRGNEIGERAGAREESLGRGFHPGVDGQWLTLLMDDACDDDNNFMHF